MDLKYYNSYAEVDLDAIRDNFAKVQAHIGPNQGQIPVIKGNAYGMGTLPIARTMIEDCGVGIVGNAQIVEAAQIREAGYKDVDILIMGGAPFHAIPYAVTYRLQLPLFNKESVLALSKAARDQGVSRVEAQIKVETGLNRIGARPGQQLAELLDCIRECGNIEIVGCFTHFSTSTAYNDPFTLEQYGRFEEGVAQIKAAGGVKAGVPWFIIGFFIMAVLNTLGVVPAPVSAAAKFVSGQFEIIALAAIGMRVKFRDLVKEGPRALGYGLSVGVCQVLFALGLIRLFLL